MDRTIMLFSFDEKSCEIAVNYVPLHYLQPVFLAIECPFRAEDKQTI